MLQDGLLQVLMTSYEVVKIPITKFNQKINGINPI